MSSQPKSWKVTPARRAAFEILSRVEETSSYAADLVARLPEKGLSREDLSLAQEIVLGVLRRRNALDYFIERYSNRPLTGIDLAVVLALRIGIYQIRYLSKVPESAAVSESVQLVRAARKSSATGFVNAVLRSAVRNKNDAPGGEIQDPHERLSIELSHPSRLIEKWISIYGQAETLRLASANNEPPALAFRVNPLKSSETAALDYLRSEGVVFGPSALARGAFVVERGASRVVAAAESGIVYIQDPASQLVSLIVDPRPGDLILDLGAAPGSKTTHMAALTGDGAIIVAGDVYPHRMRTLISICRKQAVAGVLPVVLDGARVLPFSGDRAFDRVLIDAPCSGTGTLRRNPEIKWRLRPEDLPRLASVQSGLLRNAAESVRPGGVIVYSSCSLEPEENENVCADFLDSHREYRIRPPANIDRSLLTGEGFVRTFPHKHDADGFFVAVLERASV